MSILKRVQLNNEKMLLLNRRPCEWYYFNSHSRNNEYTTTSHITIYAVDTMWAYGCMGIVWAYGYIDRVCGGRGYVLCGCIYVWFCGHVSGVCVFCGLWWLVSTVYLR